LPTTRHRCNL